MGRWADQRSPKIIPPAIEIAPPMGTVNGPLTVALVASYIPARRVTKVSPLIALRSE